MSDIPFEPMPRWPGAPPTCGKAGLLAFDSEHDALDFHERTAPKAHMDEVYQCIACEKFHYLATYPVAKHR